MRIWAVTFKEFGGAEEIMSNGDQHMVFADSAYDMAVGAFNYFRDERLSLHTVNVVGEFGPGAHAHLMAREVDSHEECCGYSGDTIELRPYDVIGA